MKNQALKINILAISLLLINAVSAQQQFTPYDDAPSNIKSYKPAYNHSFPTWAKMLYQYPVNYFEITEAFKTSGDEQNKSAIIRYFKNWRRNIEPWVLEDGSIQLPNMVEYYQRLKQLQLSAEEQSLANAKSVSNWTFLGPKETFWLNESGSSTPPSSCPWQVNVYSFDVSVSNPNILYCGTETHYVNKSIDQGVSWQLLGQNYVFGGGVTATQIHPSNPDIVYVAAGNQIHKTIDGGNTWIPMLETSSLFSADRLAIDPQNPDKIIAASNTGVYISLDAGESWERTWTSRAYDIQIKPDNSNIIYALTTTAGKFSVIKSTDGGFSFVAEANFPTDINNESGGLLAATPADPSLILVVMLSSNYTPYLYKGNMNDGSWDLLATGETTQFPMNNGQGYFDLVLEISPLDADLIFAGTTTLFKSSNAGQNFHAIGGYYGSFSIHPDIQDMKLLPDGDVWVATDGGMNYTTDQFTNVNNYFSRTNGIVGSDMWGFDQGWNEDIVVGGRYHNGNTSIADFYGEKALRMGGAESPTGWVLQGKSRHVAFNDLGNGWILPSTAEGQPEGRFIFSKYPNMDEYGGRRSNIVFHPNYYGVIYVGEGDGFWKSSDMGVTYDLLYDFGTRVRYLQISYHNPNVLYADVVSQGLFKSSDGGQTWEAKPSLTSGDYGGSYWKGRTFFAISPTNENVIYACLQNGTWTDDIGEIFKSTDGGDTWEDWTGSLSEYTKNIVIQPDANGNDIVYLFSISRNGQSASVFKRDETMDDWDAFANNYPAGNSVNLALPFFRDAKLRVGGSSGVWESPMAEEEFMPIINPWVNSPINNCMLDTLQFDDHSILNHQGASWQWAFTPEPEYLENANIRNPKVVLGNPGSYSVSLSVTVDGNTYSKEIIDMVTTTTCPSLEDCTNPAELPKDIWELVYVDSEETNYPGLAIMSFDDDPSTIWHTRWSTGSDPYPHEIQVYMGDLYKSYEFTYLPRQNGSNGRIKEYELYISDDITNWGLPVSSGEFVNSAAPQTIVFDESQIGRYFRLVALSEVNGNEWASAAEFSLLGCTDLTNTSEQHHYFEDLKAFPIPTSGMVEVTLPLAKNLSYTIINTRGQVLQKGEINSSLNSFSFNLETYNAGVYLVRMISETGVVYRVKLVKE